MKGEGFIYTPGHGDVTECIVFDRAPDMEILETIQHAVGGNIEAVKYFNRLPDGRRCVAFCDEDGKQKQLPVNNAATAIWHAQLIAYFGKHDFDSLRGPVVCIVGDAEFMEAL